MTDSRAMLEHLLGALRQAGHPEEADAFEHQFSALGWRVGPQDQLTVLAALQRATTAKLAREEPTEPTELAEPNEPDDAPSPPPRPEPRVPPALVRPLPAPPSRFQVLEDASPWVATLPAAWSFVEAVHAVFEATSRHALRLALTKVFVEHLGLEPGSLDETDRIAHQTTLTHLSVIARHEDFFVLLVESTYAGHHLTSLDLPFRLHPRALVFAFECEHRIRVVTRRAAGSEQPITSRVLRGRGLRSFPEDDVLVWARRLASLEPGPHDDGRALARRAYDAIGQSATEIVRAWDSCPLDPSHVPGPDWEGSPRHQVRHFLQPEPPEPRLGLGLEAELRSAFPWRSRDGVTIEYRGYVVRSLHDDGEEAVRRKQDTRAEIELLLVHRGPEADAETPLTLHASILIPDQSGLFVLRGERLVFVPGRTTSEDSPLHGAEDEDEDEDEDDTEDDTEAEAEAEAGANLLAADDLEQEQEEQEEATSAEDVADPAKYAGACLVPLLRWSVGRRLRWFGAKLLHGRRGTAGTPNAFKAWMGRWSDAAGRVRMSSTAVLARHLEPPTSFRLRVLQVDLLGPPPAWACLELSRAVPPGFAYPVAGARIGPAGVLAAPIPQGSGVLCLSAAAASAVSSNPRAAGSAWNATRRPFIARALEAWAELPAGTLAEPLLAAHGRTLRGTFTRAPGSRLVLRLVRRDALCERGVGHWHLDLPARVELKDIATLCAADDLIAPGTPLLELDGGTWGNDPRPREHRLLNVAKAIQLGKSRTKSSRFRVHAPPSLTGRLDVARPVSIEDVVNADDYVIVRRASFTSHHHVWPDRAVLRDGRTATVEWVLPEDLPWNEESGEVAAGVLLDPSVHEATSDISGGWRDGTTGDPIEAPGGLEEVTLVGQRLVPPDPDLRARVLDGWGHPRSPDDPHLTYGELRWLEASRPSQAAAIHRVAEATHGTIAPGTTIIELSLASHVPLPFFVRDVADTDEEPRSLPPYDPTRAPRPTAWCEDRPPGGPWVWRCACGQLRGSARAQERCLTCNEPVARQLEVEAQHVIDLPYPLIHPWRRSLLASLLGITVDELRAITDSEDCSELAALTEIALRQPLRSLRERLSRTQERELRLALLLQLEELEGALGHGLVASDLWLTRLQVLSPRLLFDGYRLGAPDLLESPLTKHYRSILSVVKLAQGRIDSLPPLRQAHWIELQKRVDELFGSLEGAPASGTLAELWRRVWPTTAPRSIPLAVPGLFCRASGRELLAFDTTCVWAEADVLHQHTARLTRGMLGPEGPLEVDVLAAPAIDPRDEQAWLERGAWGYLSGPGLVALAAILLGIDGDARVAARIRALLPASATELPAVGPVLLEQLVRGLEPPRGCPSRLARLLLARTPLVLPNDDNAAHRLLSERLVGVVDPDDRGALVASTALTTVLCGFWRGAPTPSHPSGWAWAPTCSDAPSGFRRTVPRISDPAWQRWPDFQLLVDPLGALRSGAAKRSVCAGTGAWFGLPASERAVGIDWGQAPVVFEPIHPEPPPLPMAPLTEEHEVVIPVPSEPPIVTGPLDVPPLDAVVLDTSIAVWLTANL